jgi:hypothetical protein
MYVGVVVMLADGSGFVVVTQSELAVSMSTDAVYSEVTLVSGATTTVTLVAVTLVAVTLVSVTLVSVTLGVLVLVIASFAPAAFRLGTPR